MINSKNNGEDKTEQVTLKVAETCSKFVGRGMTLVEPKVMEEIGLSIGDVLDTQFFFGFLCYEDKKWEDYDCICH